MRNFIDEALLFSVIDGPRTSTEVWRSESDVHHPLNGLPERIPKGERHS